MQEGIEICREIAEVANKKFSHDIDKAKAWARVEARRRFKLQDSHPYPLDLTLRVVEEQLRCVRSQFNQSHRVDLPSPRQISTTAPVVAPVETKVIAKLQQPPKNGVSSASQNIIAGIYLSQVIGGKTYGTLFGRDIPALHMKYCAYALGQAKVAYVLGHLRDLVEPDEMVQESVSDEQLGSLFAEAQQKADRCVSERRELLTAN